MNRNMKQWAADIIAAPVKAPLPLLSFPCTSLMDVTVQQLVNDSALQARGMKLVADRVRSAAAVSLMDLSVEAEAFGAFIHVSRDEVPTVVGALISEEEEALALAVPAVGAGRTGICTETIRTAARTITDRPVLAGIIGPYSLASRLMDVSETMIYCYDEPDMVHIILEKCTAFLMDYCNAFRESGADGVVMAEPLAGLLSPALAREFAHPYAKWLIEKVQTDDFCVIYHNCGNNVPLMVQDIYELGALGYHFGDAIDMMDVLPQAPADVLVMGNVSPAAQFRGGTPESIAQVTTELLETCGTFPNYVISGGCDVPPQSPWENIDAFFAAAAEYYRR
ncbi:MAG: uroporphyrinogen decarboxylase family protein [Oscillospiraceae bacterium]|nr:uroporphyrinogen decarboxylase family protein [Oscillospiraceae bacterium]